MRTLLLFPVFLLLFTGWGLPATPGAAWVETAPPGRVLATAVHPFHANGTLVEDRIVLAEIFTATWCPPCAPAERAIERLIDEHSPGLNLHRHGNATRDAVAFALLSYHPFPDIGGEDPFGTPEGHARLAAKHDVFWFPSFYVDGIYEDRPASRQIGVDAGMEGMFHTSYGNLIRAAQEDPPVFQVLVESTMVPGTTDAWDVTVTLRALRDARVALYAQGALWEDPVRFAGSNGIDEHRMVVRSLAPRATLPDGMAQGDDWTYTWRLEAPPAADPARTGFTFFIETAWHAEEARPLMPLVVLAGLVAAGVIVVAAIDVRRGRPPVTPTGDPA